MEDKPASIHQNLIININIISDKNQEFNIIIQNEENNSILITATLNNNFIKKKFSKIYFIKLNFK